MTSRPSIIVEIRNISYQRDQRSILQHVDLEVARHEIVTLIGPNGAGKSTLIKILLGLTRPDAGQVIRNRDIRVGYMPQKLKLNPLLPISVKRFMTLQRPLPVERIRQALAETGTEHLLNQSMESLSGGENQRVLLSRAMLLDPDLLVLDEPVQGVDFNGQVALYRLITEIRQRHGCAILMVSHDLNLVMSSTDRVVCLNHHVCCSGHPEGIQSDPDYVAMFGQPPAMLPYSHDHDHRHDIHGNIIKHDAKRHSSDSADG